MTMHKGRAAGRRWRLLDVASFEKVEIEGWHTGSISVARDAAGHEIARYSYRETPAPHSAYDLEIREEWEIHDAAVAELIERVIRAQDAEAAARAALAAVANELEETSEERAERAMLAGMGGGCAAFNEARGCALDWDSIPD